MIFNRPKYTFKTLKSIKKASPKQLFISSDGARKSKQEEKRIIEQLRKDVLSKIDWDCEVKTNFRKKNGGCRIAIPDAITWFFKHVEQGIILEDDCVPNQSFYPFCEAMLEKYKDNEKISMITGTSNLFNDVKKDNNYYFSKFYSVWGWATWKRSWKNFDLKMKKWNEHKKNNTLAHIFNNKDVIKSYKLIFNKASKIDTWAYPWAYSCLFKNTLSITPTKNLVSNIGEEGVHYQKSEFKNPLIKRKTQKINIKNTKHPKKICQNNLLDNITFKNIGFIKKNNNNNSKAKKKRRRFSLKKIIQLRFITKPLETFVKKIIKRNKE
jgi:hypothetical protein